LAKNLYTIQACNQSFSGCGIAQFHDGGTKGPPVGIQQDMRTKHSWERGEQFGELLIGQARWQEIDSR
jgi:hypothetical protein